MEGNFQDLRQTKQWAKYLEKIGWKVNKIYEYLYVKKVPLLPVEIVKWQRPNKIDLRTLENLKKSKGLKIIYCEPKNEIGEELKKLGFKKTKSSFLPKKTIWIDLNKSKSKILGEMKAKTRYNLGLAKRKSLIVKVISGKKILQTGLLDVLDKNARRLKIFKMPKSWFKAQVESFEEKCFGVLAYYKNSLAAGNFYMTSKDTCFHSHNGSSKLGRKLMAPTLCVGEGILEAKRRSLKIFDFDGIWDGSKSLKRWRGFSRFKKSFGGKEVNFPGCFRKIIFF